MTSVGSTPARSQVLVVGAGPVGLLAALRLRQQGISVRVLDQQQESRAHTFPVIVHPQTVRLLVDLGLSTPLSWKGRLVERLALFVEGERRAVLKLPAVAGSAAGLFTLPQDVLRRALAHALSQQGVEIEWRTRLLSLAQDRDRVWGHLSREAPPSLTGAGGAEPVEFEADYVLGADGYESTVREAAGLKLVGERTLQTFGFFDVITPSAGNEATVALAGDYVSSVYPLQEGRSRFSFQLGSRLGRSPDASAFHELLRTRLPWITQTITSVEWGGMAEFRRALVDRYGVGRVWLAGEAAHLTGPLGVQSLNVGMDEANELALRMAEALRQPGRPAFGPHYDERRRWQWQKLLGRVPYAPVAACTWPQARAAELIAALPASGDDLDELVDQLSLWGRVAPQYPRPSF